MGLQDAPPEAAQAVGEGELWRHADPRSTPMWKFLQHVNTKHKAKLEDYHDLHQWSIDNLGTFWAEVWHFVGIKASRPFDLVVAPNAAMFPRPDFFAGARLNFAENLLFPASVHADAVAVITVTEQAASERGETTWAQLRDQTRRCAAALRAAGVGENDVVAGFVSNHVHAVVAMLAAASLGALWTGLSPDNGVGAVLDRLVQIRPKVLFADNGAVYNGKEWPSLDKTAEIVGELGKHGLELVVVVEFMHDMATGVEELRTKGLRVEELRDFLHNSPDEPLRFAQLPSSHPLYILYSSGTTGLPKAIVHSAGGTLIQHMKEHHLHASVTPCSRMLYYTTTSWMMWHWTVSALAVGCSLVLYSGSPFRPHGHLSLPRLLSSLRVTHFGTSAAYLAALEANDIRPVADSSLDMSALEVIFSTASPLAPSTFSFVYRAFPPKVNLASITGGTDIISLFGAGCPLLPVRAGEIQCVGLGMAVSVVDSSSSDARAVCPTDAPGDLVCRAPFPSQPLTFYGPDGAAKYRDAYFSRFPALWHHGDFVRRTAAGGLVMLGRSDAVLKPQGVRFGSAEIYNLLTRHFAAEVADAVCVGRRRETVDRDETVCLFVVPCEGIAFDAALRERIKATVRRELSARHVPGIVEECARVPKTANGKKIEVAVKQILSGMPVKINASVANPEALEWFRAWAQGNP